jgi:hypothetical protein
MPRNPTTQYGVAPREHVPAQPPRPRRMAQVPKGHPVAGASVPHVGRPPKPHAVGAPPNPRRPKLVRDVDGGHLQDLFALFPDLPWPHPRPRRARRMAETGGPARRALRRRVR